MSKNILLSLLEHRNNKTAANGQDEDKIALFIDISSNNGLLRNFSHSRLMNGTFKLHEDQLKRGKGLHTNTGLSKKSSRKTLWEYSVTPRGHYLISRRVQQVWLVITKGVACMAYKNTYHSRLIITATTMSYSLAFLLLCIFLSNAAGDSCAEGFMDLSLLETKAATPVGSLADEALADNTETRWIITNQFNCSSVTIKEILIGADIRTEHGKRNEYPSIEVWRLQSYWTWVDGNWKRIYYYRKSQSVPIELSPHNFTTNGLYRYVLPTPISFSSNNNYDDYRIGVYQPIKVLSDCMMDLLVIL